MRFLNSVQDFRKRAETEEEASLRADEHVFRHTHTHSLSRRTQTRTHTQISAFQNRGVNRKCAAINTENMDVLLLLLLSEINQWQLNTCQMR